MDSPRHAPESGALWARLVGIGSSLVVWLLALGSLWILKPFFLLILLTFLFAYIQEHAVQRLKRRIASRLARVITVFVAMTGGMVGVVSAVWPHLYAQAVQFAKNLPRHRDAAAARLEGLCADLGFELAPDTTSEAALRMLLGQGDPADGALALENVLAVLGDVGSMLIGAGSAFLLALLFSFLIVLDLPFLLRSTRRLAETRIGWIYRRVAPGMSHFGVITGRALEAQFLIALVNTLLTTLGMVLFGLPGVAVLSAFVLICGMIPVLGTFISSVPILLASLEVGGATPVLWMVAWLVVIHGIETYLLNPHIYGHTMRMNPVLVLVVLFLSGKLFGIWGLVLGLPIVNYVFRYAIRHDLVPDPVPVPVPESVSRNGAYLKTVSRPMA